jgi:probable phosphoglycerate mutase
MAIHLIRHAETPGNVARVVQTPDTPLSARGLVQAERLAERLRRAGVTRILASDLTRAALTAQRVQAATGAALEFEPLLQERNFGDIRGTPYAELGVDLFAPDYAPPGGETWEVFHARVDRAWRRVCQLAAGSEGSLAVVTHGLVCVSLAMRHLALPAAARPERGFANTSLTTVEAQRPHRVTLFNCTIHLEQESARGPSGPRV